MTDTAFAAAMTATIDEGQALAESLMLDTCTIRRKTGNAVRDGLHEVPEYETVYAGPCKLQTPTAATSPQDAGGRIVAMAEPELHLPWASPRLKVEDEATFDTSRDPQLVGRKCYVTAPFAKTHGTARRHGVRVEES